MVTGGAGFIGSHLTRRLLDMGNEVLVVDNFFSGTRQNIENWSDTHDFELMRHDVTFPLYVEVDEIYQPRLPGLAHPLSARPGADHQDLRARCDQHARAWPSD